MSALEDAPPELLLIILGCCDSTQDVQSAIAASPCLLRVFVQNRSSILWAVLRRAIHPRALPHAVAAINMPNTRYLKCHPKRIEVLSEFFGRYRARDWAVTGRLSREGGSSQLAKLHRAVERHINAYVSDTIPMLAACADFVMCESNDDGDLLDGPQPATTACSGTRRDSRKNALVLSDTERARLETAFYRFEIQCRAFQTRVFSDFAISPPRQCHLFLDHLQPWEVEELGCLQQYFLSSLAYFYTQTIYQFGNDARKNTFHDASVTEWIIFDTDNPGLFQGLDMTPLWNYSSPFSSRRLDVVRQLAQNGLECIGKVLCSSTDPKTRTNLFRTRFGSISPFCLDNAMAFAHDTSTRDRVKPQLESFSSDQSIPPNHFFSKYSATEMFEHQPVMGKERHGIRSTGYVFWDDDRLEDRQVRAGLWKAAQPTRRICIACQSYRHMVESLSAESELRDNVITPAALENLISKYGEIRPYGCGDDSVDDGTPEESDAIVCSSPSEKIRADDVCPKEFHYPLPSW